MPHLCNEVQWAETFGPLVPTPGGVRRGGLADLLSWGTLVASLTVAFVATVPVNRAMTSRGRGHAAVHEMHQAHH